MTVEGAKVIEIAGDELGDIVILKQTVNIPPRHRVMCEVKTMIISPNPKTLEENPICSRARSWYILQKRKMNTWSTST